MLYADTTFGGVPIGYKFLPEGSSIWREKSDFYGGFAEGHGYAVYPQDFKVVIDISKKIDKDSIEGIKHARDLYKAAFNEWHDKTQFVQDWVNEGKLSGAGNLGKHRADILRELAEEALASRPNVNDPVEEGTDVFQMAKEMSIFGMVSEGTALAFFMPNWAVGANRNYEVVVGAQLCTKDGRRMGNAHVIATANASSGNYFIILTDAGNRVTMTEQEIRSAFYISPWISDVEEVVRKFGSRQGE